MSSQPKRAALLIVSIGVAVAILVVQLPVVVGQVRAGARVPYDRVPVLREGAELGAVRLIVDGEMSNVSRVLPSNTCAVVVVFASACPWSGWLGERAADVAASIRVPMMWLSTPDAEGTIEDFLVRHGLTQPVAQVTSWADVARLGVKGTPWAFWVDSENRYVSPLNPRDPSVPDQCRVQGT